MSTRAQRVAMNNRIEMAMLGVKERKAGFNPDQLRDPHTGEWVDVLGPLTHADAKVGARVMSQVSGWLGSITKVDDRPSGSGWRVKVRWDAQPGHPIRETREGTQEGWVTKPGLNLNLVKGRG